MLLDVEPAQQLHEESRSLECGLGRKFIAFPWVLSSRAQDSVRGISLIPAARVAVWWQKPVDQMQRICVASSQTVKAHTFHYFKR